MEMDPHLHQKLFPIGDLHSGSPSWGEMSVQALLSVLNQRKPENKLQPVFWKLFSEGTAQTILNWRREEGSEMQLKQRCPLSP